MGRLCDEFVWRPFKHEVTALLASFWSQFDDPVGHIENIQVVFDYEHRVPHRNERVENVHQAGNIFKVQTRCGFVKDKECACASRFPLEVIG